MPDGHHAVALHLGEHGGRGHGSAVAVGRHTQAHGHGVGEMRREPVVRTVQQDDAVQQRDAGVVQLDERAAPGEAEAGRDPELVHLGSGGHADGRVPDPPGDDRVQRLAALLAEHLRVTEAGRETHGVRPHDGHAYGDRPRERSSTHLVTADHEGGARVEELVLQIEGGIRDRHQPAGTGSGTSPNVSGWSLRIDQRSMGQVMTNARPTTWSIGTKPLVGPLTL